MLALPETIFPRPLTFSNFGTSERLQSRPNLTSCQPVLEHQSALNNPSASRKANTLIIPSAESPQAHDWLAMMIADLSS